MQKRTKLLLLVIAYFGLLIIDGCTKTDDPCPGTSFDYIPFYDFATLTALLPNTSEVEATQKLVVELRLEDLTYLSSTTPIKACSHWGLINTAYGCSPLPDGYDGPKFPIEKMEISSDQDFNINYPANSILNELVFIDNVVSSSPTQFLLSEITQNDLQFMYPEDLGRVLTIEARPEQTNVEHVLTIKITKSNGEILETTVGPIIWK